MVKNVTINNNTKIQLSYVMDNYQFESGNIDVTMDNFSADQSPNDIYASCSAIGTTFVDFYIEANRDDTGFTESVFFSVIPRHILYHTNILNHTYKLNITNITLKLYGAANNPTFTFNGKIPIDINDLNRTINVTVSRKGNSAFSHKNTDIFIAAYYQAKLNGTEEELGTPNMEYTITISREYK